MELNLGQARISELSHRQLQLHSFAAVILSTLDSWTKSRFDEALASNFFLNDTDAAKLFVLVCRSSPL